ncbi:hypothetical protein NECAME_00412 [Necator americanus]|uniref:Uncharacterized protein n=1 Tax=Necator americanus TaxID=51031 RepID=W2TAH3_NECAM|nr:hypothetical protein NECAME_00412 [Necator americanus]ETN79035.1 hypothetical protein NECAME_00412 [Necator americanus]
MIQDSDLEEDAARERQGSGGHMKYFVEPNEKFIERSTKDFSKFFNNANYARMLDRLSEDIYRYYADNLETREEFLAKMSFMEAIERVIRKRKWIRHFLLTDPSIMSEIDHLDYVEAKVPCSTNQMQIRLRS